MQCEIRGMNFFQNDDGRRRFVTLAIAEVHWPELGVTLAGCRLVHYPDKGYRALPPLAKLQNGAMCVAWFDRADFAMAARDAMLAMYEKMGGKTPEAAANNAAAKRRVAERNAKPDAIDTALDAVEAELAANPGKGLMDAAADVYERGDWKEFKTAAFAECERAVANAKRKGKPVPVRSVEEIDAAMPVEEMGLSRGLERTLGIAE
jgi:hypothetical protein